MVSDELVYVSWRTENLYSEMHVISACRDCYSRWMVELPAKRKEVLAGAQPGEKKVLRLDAMADRANEVIGEEVDDDEDGEPEPTDAEALTRIERRMMAFDLRIAGMGFREIVAELQAQGVKCSLKTVWKDVQEVAASLRQYSEVQADAIREIEMHRLDKMQAALTSDCDKGDIYAINTALRVMERRAKMLGVDAPAAEGKGPGSGVAMLPAGVAHAPGMTNPPTAEKVSARTVELMKRLAPRLGLKVEENPTS